MFVRKQIFEGSGKETLFFWGARQTGKTTLLKTLYPNSLYINLLLNSEFLKFSQNPDLLRQIITAKLPDKPVIIDEVQRIPEILNEVQWLITNTQVRFILSGSSPRKIVRSGHNLLGGRALRYELYPLVFPEIDNFDLMKALNSGLLPRHYLAEKPKKLIAAYIGSYLRDEIIAEASLRNIAAFTRFLESAAFSNGEIVNYSNIAADCGVSSVTVKDYFQILEDTMTGRFLPAFTKKAKRRVIAAPKFYYFDIGVANYLLKRNHIEKKSEQFGSAFEHFIYLELYAHSNYSDLNYSLSYWRTATQIEVDFVLGDHEIAIEVKANEMVNSRHIKGLKQFGSEYNVKRLIVVSNDEYYRKIENVEIMPWAYFLNELWGGNIIK
ncbi:MAG: AAA family ATPase [Bacteroidetes bacterium GWF2_38_335]|nr:MAG: AAA family ATPase [Bacteroidetes bacterium GWF2_38_335]OFY76968.1 MAG: AAA family ATPase [Bacteroidetes bacterium RIFOXYA12_FULL_38_20]HBS86823.1 AAA family ATPase [Bacteroidales bacterium]